MIAPDWREATEARDVPDPAVEEPPLDDAEPERPEVIDALKSQAEALGGAA